MSPFTNRSRDKAFTLPEVTLAIGVVAFGLVAVFSILPFGLTAQKDNQEETVIRYEAQYWTEMLLGNGLMSEEMKRVERVELTAFDDNSTPTHTDKPYYYHLFHNPYRGRKRPGFPGIFVAESFDRRNPANNKQVSYRKDTLEKAKGFWPSDVVGWLLTPARFPSSVDVNGSWGNYALVKAMNGSLADRLYGAEPGTVDFHFPQRDFAMGYILQVRPERNPDGEGGSRINITFHWPIFEDVTDALNQGEFLGDVVMSSRFDKPTPQSGRRIPRMNSKSFSIRTPKVIKEALLENHLTLQERRFMKELRGLRPGDLVSENGMRERFPSHRVNKPRRVRNDGNNLYWEIWLGQNNFVLPSRYQALASDPSFHPDSLGFGINSPFFYPPITTSSFAAPLPSPRGHSGMVVNDGFKDYEITWVSNKQNPILGKGDSISGPFSIPGIDRMPYYKRGAGGSGEYEVRFLRLDPVTGRRQTWEGFLLDCSKPRMFNLPRGQKIIREGLLYKSAQSHTLNRSLFYTTHRPIAPDEVMLNNLSSKRPLDVQGWAWAYPENWAPPFYVIQER